MFYRLLIFFFIVSNAILAQSEWLKIDSIQIEGLKKTKEFVVLRELDFVRGDSISFESMLARFEKNRLLLLNLGLFSSVQLNVSKWENNLITIKIELIENWYLVPVPNIELADRNFNVWWVEQNHSLKRINLGLWLIHANLTGRRDYARLVSQIGFTQKLELDYRLPYINKKGSLGIEANVYLSRNKEISYTTDTDSLVFYRDDDEFMQYRSRIRLGLLYRPKLFQSHIFNIEFDNNRINDKILKLNPLYFNNSSVNQKYFLLSYQYSLDRRDIRPYPLNGYYFGIKAEKQGIGIFNDLDLFYAKLTVGKFSPIWKKLYWEKWLRIRWMPFKNQVPYYNNRALGYLEDYLRAYEYYVIDGQDYAYFKSSFHWELINTHLKLGKYMALPAFKKLSFKMYLNLNSDIGYVQDVYFDSYSSLSNKLLTSSGLGLDFVINHNAVLQIEYSLNQLLEKGVYLHYKFSFQ